MATFQSNKLRLKYWAKDKDYFITNCRTVKLLLKQITRLLLLRLAIGLKRGTLGDAEHRNTAENIDKYRNIAKKIGKYRNTASKVDEIPKLQKRGIRRNLLKDFDLFARRMRLKDIFHGKENKQHPFYVKSTWEPPVQQSVALETFLEEVKQPW